MCQFKCICFFLCFFFFYRLFHLHLQENICYILFQMGRFLDTQKRKVSSPFHRSHMHFLRVKSNNNNKKNLLIYYSRTVPVNIHILVAQQHFFRNNVCNGGMCVVGELHGWMFYFLSCSQLLTKQTSYYEKGPTDGKKMRFNWTKWQTTNVS